MSLLREMRGESEHTQRLPQSLEWAATACSLPNDRLALVRQPTMSALPTKTLDRRAQRSRDLILEALFALMTERSYERLTIQNVIDRAGVGRATFYAHFESKDELLAASIG